MQFSRFVVTVIALVLGNALLGCSGTNPFASPPTDAFSTARGFDDPNRQPYDQLAQAFPQHDVAEAVGSQMPVQPSQPNAENAWLASLRNTRGAISEALTITPQTIPAPDPTSLSNQPGDVGGALNYHAAKVYEAQGNSAGAMALYQKTLQMAPNDVRAMIGYARILDREGNFREAERLYQQALGIEPTNVVALNDLGMIYARQRMFDEALQALHQAVELQPTSQRYRNNIAIVLIDAGRPDEAFEHLAAVHSEATTHYNLGFLLARRNMHDAAIWHLQKSLALNPQATPARQLIDSLVDAGGHASQTAAPPSFNVSGTPTSATLLPRSPQGSSQRPLPPL